MSGRIAVALFLASFLAAAHANVHWEWMTAAVEEPAPPPNDESTEPGGGDSGWLIDPNG